ncbi:MAG: antibiotic biosynthesis monooxygenase [Deltaproteobacteria bacterium]|nr:antibiotic biosynthesis monooxygenase [Deltaproteobacteria bacterium]
MIAVIAKVPIQAEKKEIAMDAVKTLMAEVAKEEGTLYYTLNIDEKNPDTIVFMERYRDMDALTAHSSTPHFKQFMEQAMTFAAGAPEINVLNEIDSI